MASVQYKYEFLPGRQARGNDVGPGILLVENKFKFRMNGRSKGNMIYRYYCVQQSNPEFGCKAKATVVKKDDGTFFLYSCDANHNHFINEGQILADKYRLEMIDIVRKDPTKPVGEAIKEVKLRLAREHENDKETFNSVIDALGNHHALEQRLTEARLAIIGPTPKSRKDFNINTFKEKNLISEDAIVLDSENLPENWESLLEPKDQETSYHWDKMNDAMMELDESDEHVDEIQI